MRTDPGFLALYLSELSDIMEEATVFSDICMERMHLAAFHDELHPEVKRFIENYNRLQARSP